MCRHAMARCVGTWRNVQLVLFNGNGRQSPLIGACCGHCHGCLSVEQSAALGYTIHDFLDMSITCYINHDGHVSCGLLAESRFEDIKNLNYHDIFKHHGMN